MVSPVHIVFLSPYAHRNGYSGARRRVEELSRVYALMLNVRVTVVSPWKVDETIGWVVFGLDGSFLKKIYSLIKLHIILWKLRPDFLLSESPLAPVVFGGCKVIHVIHDAKFVTKHGRRGSGIVRFFHWISARISHKVLTVSMSERERISKALFINKEAMIVSYNGLSDRWFRNVSSNKDNKIFDIVYVSNFAAHKGHLDLLRAMRGFEGSFVFVGTDFGTLTECKNLAFDLKLNVKFLSALSEDELIDIYDRSKVFVFPSGLEGFGIPFLEARARGLPVVANDIPVFRELRSLVGGDIVDCRDPIALRDAIFSALNSITPYQQLDTFGWDALANSMLSAMLNAE